MNVDEGNASHVPQAAARRRLAWAGLACAALVLLVGVISLAPWSDEPVRFAQGLELVSATTSIEASPGHDLHVSLRFLAAGPLDAEARVFTHLESQVGACRRTLDVAPRLPTNRWKAGEVYAHGVHIPIPSGCRQGDVEVFAGLSFRSTGRRLAVLNPARSDGRVYVGEAKIVPGPASEEERTRDARALVRRARLLAPLDSWLPWLLGLALACVITLVGSSRGAVADAPSADPSTSAAARYRSALLLALPALVFLTGMLMVLEFIKDDAYISFRYAHNLVHGQGLVFNAGERLEGITNFLWTLLLAPFEALGLDLFQVCEVLGALLGIGTLVFVAQLTRFLQDGEGQLASFLWGALWLASSSSLVLYTNSGLEQPLVAFLPSAGALVLYRSRAATRSARSERGYLGAGLLLGAGCVTRPELHLVALLVALPTLVDVLRARKLTRAELNLALGVAALTAPVHLFRYLYYGSLVPNTFYVKTSSDLGVLSQGLETLREMMSFNLTGLLLVLMPLAFLERRHLLEKLSSLLIALAFLAYYARVGVDEMAWHRLYIPALPFACALASVGAQSLLARSAAALRLRGPARFAPAALAWAALSLWIYYDLRFTYDEQHGFNGHGDFAGTYHPDMGKFLVRHERPGGLVAFQDMGSTPYYAPDLNFLDFFGLVDSTVAHARHDHGLHAFINGDPVAKRAYDAEMRGYFFGRNPEWTILTIYADEHDRDGVSRAFAQDPTGAAFGNYYRNNPIQFGLWDDPRFRERYVPVRTWPRAATYYLALWRRRDLWVQTPREVVLDTPPPQASRTVASFAGGLELLGHELTPEVPENHEAFVTTWWRLPGPMPHDLMFFVHFVSIDARMQVPADHVPGDWMYPADRWQPGQILEDRTLFQLPPEVMTVGRYTVYLGVYRRTTGERLALTQGDDAGENRVQLGTLNVKPLLPLVNALIPRTDVERMRAHPERIVEARPRVAEAEP